MRTVVVLIVLVLTSNAMADAGSRVLSAEQVLDDVALAREAYSRIHPGYDRYTGADNLDAAWDALAARGSMRVGEFYLALQGILAMIRCDHTKAELPKDMAAARRSNPVYLPIRWEVVDNRGLVIDALDESDLQRGDEILAIDGVGLDELIERFLPLIPVDGYTDHVRESQLAYSGEFMGGAIEHFGAAAAPVAATATLRIRRGGEIDTITTGRINFDAWRELVARTAPFRRNFVDSIRYEAIGDETAYIAVDTFVNYRQPVDPDDLLSPIFDRIKREKRHTLILDLRKNGGGSNDAMRSLFSHLIDRKARLNKPSRIKTLDLDGLREHLDTWEKRALNPKRWQFRRNNDGTYSPRWFLSDETSTVKPSRNAFRGRLIVLAGRDNSSGSTNLIAKLQDMGRATVIGDSTGGSAEGPTAGVLLFLTLPESGIRTRIPALRGYNAVEAFPPGMGVIPDIEIDTTFEDLADGKDPVLDAAKALAAEGGQARNFLDRASAQWDQTIERLKAAVED